MAFDNAFAKPDEDKLLIFKNNLFILSITYVLKQSNLFSIHNILNYFYI